MSVVNDMLRALDARREGLPPGATTVAAVRPARSRRLFVIAGVGVFAVSIVAFANWPALVHGPATSPRPLRVAEDVPVAAALPQPTATVPTATPASAQLVALSPEPTSRSALKPERPRTVTTASVAAPPTAALTTQPASAISTAGVPEVLEKVLVPISGAQRAALAYRHAADLAASGHASQAIERAMEALTADPDHVGARQLAAVLMFETQRLDEAAALLQTGLDRMPRQPQLAFLLARLRAEGGDAAGALELLPATAPLSAEAHGLRAAILARQARYAEALPSYEAALRQDPGNASWWLGLGIALEADGQAQLAKQALQRARSIGRWRPEVVTFLDRKIATLN